MSELQNKQAELALSEFGQNGGVLVTDTEAHTGAWRAMLVMADAVFTTLTTNFTKNDATTLAVAADWGTLTKGTTISGKITAVKLTSGAVLLVA